MQIKPVHALTAAGVLLGVSLLGQVRAAGSLSFYIHNVQLTFSGFTPVLRLTVVVQNPSGQLFTIRSITGNLFCDSDAIGNISMFQTINIAPNSQTQLPIDVRLKTLAIVSDILSLIQKGSGIPKVLRLEGYVNANNQLIDLDMTYKLS